MEALKNDIPEELSNLELTPYQRIFYNEWLLNPLSSDYNLVIDNVLTGDLDIDRHNKSLIRFVNENLLISSNVAEKDGKLYWAQRTPIADTDTLIKYYPDGLSEEELLADVVKPFDLENELLVRFYVIKQGAQSFRCIYIFQHILGDGLSTKPIFVEYSRYYNDDHYINPISLKEQFTLHQKLSSTFDSLLEENSVQMHEFWRKNLEGLSGVDIHFLQNNAHSSNSHKDLVPHNKASEYRFSFQKTDLVRIKQLTRKYKLTPYIYGQFVFGILLHKITNQKRIGISFPAAILEGKEIFYGAHINNLIIDYKFDTETTLAGLINNTGNYYSELKASKAKYLPVYEIVRYASNSNLFEFGFIQTDLKDHIPTNIGIHKIDIQEEFNIDLPYKLVFEQELAGEQLNYRVRYDNTALDTGLVFNFITLYQKLFNDILEDLLNNDTHKRIADYQLLNASQYQEIIHDWNDTSKEYTTDKTIHQQFEEQVTKTPDNIAIVYEGIKLTYRELNERSNKLAAYLRETYHIKPDDLIALCLERSELMIVSILAVLKSGAGYVPIDPAYPKDRIRFILEDTNTKIVLTNEIHQARLEEITADSPVAIELIDGQDLQAALVKYPVTNIVTSALPANLFYIVYTSGTTSKPKGVMIEHKQISVIIDAIRDAYNFGTVSKITAFTSFGFDVSTSEFFIALLNGNELHLLSEQARTDVDALSKYLLANDIEYAYLPPVILANLPKVEYPSLKTIIYAGEPCDYETGKYWSMAKRLYNYYGPSETNIATGKLINNGDIHLIGRPIANATMYIVNHSLHPVPVGVVGELYIGGEGVARGYLNLPALTEERFITNPFQIEAEKEANKNIRLYKTGDLVRYLPDGNIEYIGRNDFQVKIRGYRIELGEIETKLSAYPGIKQTIVLAKKQSLSKTKYLVGYYVADEVIDQNILTSYLAEHLPEYMIPSVLVHLYKLPVTVNGKVDRDALPNPEYTDDNTYQAPENELQKKLCTIYGEILELDVTKIGIDDDFFRLGGNSIAAIKLVSKLNKIMGTTLNVTGIFSHKTIRKLAVQLVLEPAATIKISAPKISDPEQQVLSFAQERLWFIEAYEGGSNAYNIPVAFKLKHTTNIESLVSALKAIVNRHEVLRSFIKTNPEGTGYQIVQDETKFPLVIERIEVTSLNELNTAIDKSSQHIFKLADEYPIKVTICNYASEVYVSIVIHHIAFDGWSTDIMAKELVDFYNYFESLKLDGTSHAGNHVVAPLSLQYKDFALWQRNYLTGVVLETQLTYWKNSLSGYETLNLPIDKPRPARINYSGADLHFEIDAATSYQLKAVAKELGVSMYSLLLSGYYLMLSAYSNQKDIVIGTPIANRHHQELQDMIGFFVNTLVLREEINPAESLAHFIKQVGNSLTQAQLHQDLPFEKLVSELDVVQDTSRHPIFQVMFGVQDFESQKNNSTQLFELYHTKADRTNRKAKFDITTMLNDSGEEIKGYFNYATSIFEEVSIQSYITTYKEILKQVALLRKADKKISDLTYLTATDYDKIIYSWNDTGKEHPADKTLHQLFEEQAAKTPDNIAIVYEDVTYRELNERANQLANYLKETYHIKPDDRILLCLDRSEHMLISILAVLKSGGAYVPIDPTYPEDRISYIIEDTGTNLILTNSVHEEKLRSILKNESVSIEKLDDSALQHKLTTHPKFNPIHIAKPNNLSYVIYTSGTTGRPKGVMIEHKGVVNFINGVSSRYGLSGDEVILMSFNYVFDGSVDQIFLALLNGYALLLTKNLNWLHPDTFIDMLIKNKVTYICMTPSLLQQLPIEAIYTLKHVVSGGEPLNTELLHKLNKSGYNLINVYGPTETTVTAIMNSDSSNVHIGRPIDNVTAYVLDSHLHPLPIGAIGELYIGGDGVGRGYLNLPVLTGERFISNPFQTEAEKKANKNSRLFKTGDLVRYLPDGNLECIGRNDFQVKIRGFRIELGEVETRLASYPGIKQAIVLAEQQSSSNTNYLVGYYVADEVIDQNLLLTYVTKHLPEYMIPSVFVQLEKLPLTINGKLDRKALPSPEFTNSKTYRAPENKKQEQLCSIYAEVLGLDALKISIDDDFFRLGGSSILAIRLTSKVNSAFHSGINLTDIFMAKSVRGLADKIKEGVDRYQPVIKLNKTTDQDKMFMIHPGNGGCEVYISLAEKLSERFSCYGVDSYNLYHKKQITNLHKLAAYYLSHIDKIQNEDEQSPYILLGWSLGGQIALEIATILEQRGVKNISVFLLDSVLNDDRLDELRTEPTNEELALIAEKAGNIGVHTGHYKDYFMAQTQLVRSPISKKLIYTQAVLFKAMLSDDISKNKNSELTNEYIQTLEFNHINYTLTNPQEQLEVVKMNNVHHFSILKEENLLVSEIINSCKMELAQN